MKILGVIGSSSLQKGRLVEGLIEAFREEGFSVSVVKRAPDGFDIDAPGKGSYARRQAGAREVVMATRERLVLMRENVARTEPDLARLVERMEEVDIVIAEGFHGAAVPTIEALRPSSARPTRHGQDPNVIALVSDEPLDGVETPLPRFALEDLDALVQFAIERLGLEPA